jgi:hypothetical protein
MRNHLSNDIAKLESKMDKVKEGQLELVDEEGNPVNLANELLSASEELLTVLKQVEEMEQRCE